MSSADLSPMSFRFDVTDDTSNQRNVRENPQISMPKILKSFDLSSWNHFFPPSPSRDNTRFNRSHPNHTNEVSSRADAEVGFEQILQNKSPKHCFSGAKNRVPVTYGRIGDTGITNLDPRSWNMSTTRDAKLRTPKGLKWPLFLASRAEKSHKNYVDFDVFASSPVSAARIDMLFDENLTDSDLKTSIDGKDSDSEEHLSVIKQNVLSLREDFNILLHELLGRNRSSKGDKCIANDNNDLGYSFGNDPIFDVSSNSSRSHQPQRHSHSNSHQNELINGQYDQQQQYENHTRMSPYPKYGSINNEEGFRASEISTRLTPTRSNIVESTLSPILPSSSPSKQVSIESTSSKGRRKKGRGASTPFRHILSDGTPLAQSYQDMNKVYTPKDLFKSNSPRSPTGIQFQHHSNNSDHEGLSVGSYRLPRFGAISPEEPMDPEIEQNDVIHVESPITDDESEPQIEINSPTTLSHQISQSIDMSKTPNNSNASDVTFHNSPLSRSNDTIIENDIEIIAEKTLEMATDMQGNEGIDNKLPSYLDVSNSNVDNNNLDELYDKMDQIVEQDVDAMLGNPLNISHRTSPISNRNSPVTLYTSPTRQSKTPDRAVAIISPSRPTVFLDSAGRSPAKFGLSPGKMVGSPNLSTDTSPSYGQRKTRLRSVNTQTPSRSVSRTPTRAASVQTELATPKSLKSKSTKRKINYWTEAFNSSYKVPGAHDTNDGKGPSSIDWDAEAESLKRNSRYPQRLRIPRLQHWNADPAEPIDMTVQNVIKYSLNYMPSHKKQVRVSQGPKFPRGKASLYTYTQIRKRGRPRKYPIGQSTVTLRQTTFPLQKINGDKSYIKPGYVALLTASGKKICYKAVYKNTDDAPDDIDGVSVYPIVMTSVCRTSLLVFPNCGHINFGESSEIFLCGYVSKGTNIQIQSLYEGKRTDLDLKASDTFCIPPNTSCHIYNKDTSEGAQIILIFINVA